MRIKERPARSPMSRFRQILRWVRWNVDLAWHVEDEARNLLSSSDWVQSKTNMTPDRKPCLIHQRWMKIYCPELPRQFESLFLRAIHGGDRDEDELEWQMADYVTPGLARVILDFTPSWTSTHLIPFFYLTHPFLFLFRSCKARVNDHARAICWPETSAASRLSRPRCLLRPAQSAMVGSRAVTMGRLSLRATTSAASLAQC